MPQSQVIADLITSAGGLLKQHLADLTDADLIRRPVPGANHGLWQLAHLAVFEVQLANLVSPDAGVTLPATSDDPARFPTKADVLDTLDKAYAAQLSGLAEMPDEQLAQPSPEAFRSFAPRLGDLLSMGPMHAMMHLGQIQVLRRALGKPRVF